MQITITIPDNLTARLEQKLGNLSQQVLVSFALNSYQNKLISTHELGQILGLESVYEVHSFLKESGVYLNYDEEELLEDIATIERLQTT
jgi:predicted HTH domain antitoxin